MLEIVTGDCGDDAEDRDWISRFGLLFEKI
jgi:hypothetical protein